MQDAHIAQLDAIHEWFTRSTRNLTEEDSTFAPTKEMFTVAQQVAHAAQTVDWFFEGAFAKEGFSEDFEGMEKDIRKVTSLASARTRFDKAIEDAKKVVRKHSDEEWEQPLPAGPIMGGMPRHSIIGALVDHTAHHRGALTVYARMVGKTAPIPYMEMEVDA